MTVFVWWIKLTPRTFSACVARSRFWRCVCTNSSAINGRGLDGVVSAGTNTTRKLKAVWCSLSYSFDHHISSFLLTNPEPAFVSNKKPVPECGSFVLVIRTETSWYFSCIVRECLLIWLWTTFCFSEFPRVFVCKCKRCAFSWQP